MTDPRHARAGPDATAQLPPDDVLVAGIGALRDEVRGAEERAAERAVEAASSASADEARAVTDRRARLFWLPLVLLASIASSVLTAIVVDLWYGPRLDALSAVDAAQTATNQEIRRLVDDAARRAESANEELQARGLAPVPISEPGEASNAQVLVDAAVAQVLASLPPEQSAAPTAAQLAAAVANYLRENPITPIGPSPAQIAEAVAAYLEANPPGDGEDGEDGEDGADGKDGEPGPPPTAEEIQAAFVAYLQTNPDALCVRGGVFTLVQGVLATGGTFDFWTCVTATGPLPGDGGGGMIDLGGG